jgi:hypothetical protein
MLSAISPKTASVVSAAEHLDRARVCPLSDYWEKKNWRVN